MATLEMPEPQPFFFLKYHALQHPETVAISTIERDYTYAETAAYATSIAGLLRRRGVQPGHVVLTRLSNHLTIFFMEAIFHEAAIFCSGSKDTVRQSPVAIDWLITDDPEIAFDPARTVVVDVEFMTEVARAEFKDPPRRYEDFNAICRVNFSSGTTGEPVAVPSRVSSHGRAPVSWLDERPFFSLIQGFSGSGVKTALSSIYVGDTYICPGDPDENVTLAQRNFVSTLQGSPAQLSEFLDRLAERDNRKLDIATVQYIGSFLSERLLQRIRDELGASVTALYGSSEVGMITMRTDVRDNPWDVGAPFAHATVEIVDDNDLPLPTGTEGIVRVRTTRRNPSYFQPGETGRGALRDGWFYPGDLGQLTTDGHLVLSGRTAEVINAGGVKFNAARLDEFLVTHDGVRDGAVIAYPDSEGGASYAALVVVDDQFDLTSLIEPLRVASGGVAPASIFRVAKVERDQNGKVPRAALSAKIQTLV
jgi:acyl-coenzyme A synthetase/AMP-(fatty) acid ligase